MQGKGLRGRTEEGKEETHKEKKKKAKSRHCKITTKHGWKEGTGLGVSKQGRLELVETYVKNSKRGLGADKAKKKVVNEKPNQSGSSKGNNQQKALDITAVSRCSTSDFESGKSETSLSKWARARSMAAKGQGKSSKHLHVEEKEDFIVVDENKKWMHKETKRYYPSSKVSQVSYLQDSLTFNEVALLNEDDTHTSNIRSETKEIVDLNPACLGDDVFHYQSMKSGEGPTSRIPVHVELKNATDSPHIGLFFACKCYKGNRSKHQLL
ncbi:hypothetical protein JHK82_050685 [Glycine max]|nr:hypothetical protein JHK82_050685 [Glycine max]